jgi:hypothetical protein
MNISEKKKCVFELIQDWITTVGSKDPAPFIEDWEVQIPRNYFEQIGAWDDLATILNQLKKESVITSYEKIWEFQSDLPPMVTSVEILANIKNFQARTTPSTIILEENKNGPIKSLIPWSAVEIHFIDNQEVFINFEGKTVHTTFEELGFLDKRSKRPNFQWKLLMELARSEGEMGAEKLVSLPKKDRDNLKQHKKILSDILKKHFQIDDEPFYDFRDENMYRIKIKLFPPLLDEEVKNEDELGIKEFLAEIPTIYEGREDSNLVSD